jgi:hypothetical protein
MAQQQATGTRRINYYDGTRLEARDVNEDVAYLARLRGLHVTRIHKTWGVALGFETSLRQDDDGFTVVIGAGIAYDCRGREIVSARTVLLPPPPEPPLSDAGAWWFDLVIAYQDPLSFYPEAATICLAEDGAGPREERPSFRWHLVGPAEDAGQPPIGLGPTVRLGEEIPLARFRLGRKRNLGAPNFGERRAAQGLVRPHIGSGQVAGTATFDFSRSCWTIPIDTTAAGFTETPHYFAGLAKHIALEPSGEIDSDGELRALQSLLGPFLSIRNPTRDGFTLEIRLAASVTPQTGALSTIAARATSYLFTWPATVDWVGLEPTGGCPPEPLFLIYNVWNFIIWGEFAAPALLNNA